MAELSELESDFEAACSAVREATADLTRDQLLHLYARYKQATEGPCSTPKPSFFDFEGKVKWTEWKNLGEMTKDEAMEEYVQSLDDWLPNWKTETKKGWVGVSTLRNLDEDLNDGDKSILDWVKEGHVDKVKACVEAGSKANSVDEDGLSLLHWACDRGHLEVVSYLVSCGAEVNCQDSEGQTPLHYASSCGHLEVVEFLLGEHADRSMKDSDGMLAVDVAENEAVKQILS